jgi:hypothetical protein
MLNLPAATIACGDRVSALVISAFSNGGFDTTRRRFEPCRPTTENSETARLCCSCYEASAATHTAGLPRLDDPRYGADLRISVIHNLCCRGHHMPSQNRLRNLFRLDWS